MAAEPMPHELTDEELAKIAYETVMRSREIDGAAWETLHWSWQVWYGAIAAAVRAALTPAVTPLAPGETVTIPDRWWLPTDTVYAGLTLNESECYPDLSVSADDGEVGVRVRLDLTGVEQLRETCDRWLRAAIRDLSG